MHCVPTPMSAARPSSNVAETPRSTYPDVRGGLTVRHQVPASVVDFNDVTARHHNFQPAIAVQIAGKDAIEAVAYRSRDGPDWSESPWRANPGAVGIES